MMYLTQMESFSTVMRGTGNTSMIQILSDTPQGKPSKFECRLLDSLQLQQFDILYWELAVSVCLLDFV
jgi:hypothetical protein